MQVLEGVLEEMIDGAVSTEEKEEHRLDDVEEEMDLVLDLGLAHDLRRWGGILTDLLFEQQ